MFFIHGLQLRYWLSVTRKELDCALNAAYEASDGAQIAKLYGAAGDASASTDEACFYWVQAYVFALEAGILEAASYRAKLIQHGREA